MNQQEWLTSRKLGIGASDAAAIFGLSPYKSALALYYEKRGAVDLPPAELEALEWGKVLERPIGDRYARETQRAVVWPEDYALQVHPTLKFVVATLDAGIGAVTPPAVVPVDAAGAPMAGPGVLEVKNVHFMLGKAWREEPPLAFQIQVQHQLAVTGFQWGSVAGLVGGSRFLWTDVPRNNHFIEMLLATEQRFWDGVLTGVPPDADASDSTTSLLRALFPRERIIEPVALPLEATEWDIQLERAKRDEKDALTRQAEASNRIKLAIGDHVAGVLRDGKTLYTHKWQARAAHAVKATEFRVLRRKGPKDAEPQP